MKNKIEAIRKEQGILQEEFAKAMGVSRQTISSLENGRYNPSILLAHKIAKFFGMTIEEVFVFGRNNMKKKDIIFGAIWLLLGLVLTALSCLETLDGFWSGMGSALVVIGIVRLLRGYRLSKSETYREAREVAETDERFHFIRNKAWAWAGYLFIIICALSTIVFRLLGQDLLCIASGGAVCLMLVLFWVSFFVLKKKY